MDTPIKKNPAGDHAMEFRRQRFRTYLEKCENVESFEMDAKWPDTFHVKLFEPSESFTIRLKP